MNNYDASELNYLEYFLLWFVEPLSPNTYVHTIMMRDLLLSQADGCLTSSMGDLLSQEF